MKTSKRDIIIFTFCMSCLSFPDSTLSDADYKHLERTLSKQQFERVQAITDLNRDFVSITEAQRRRKRLKQYLILEGVINDK